MDDDHLVIVMPSGRSISLRLWVLALIMTIYSGVRDTRAQVSLIVIGEPQAGTIEANASQTWEFIAKEGEMLSFEARAMDEALDPVLTIEASNAEAMPLISNDDYDYPTTKNALIEGFIAPDTATYRVTVSGYGATAGAFELWMLPGYGDVVSRDPLNSLDAWDTVSTLPDTEADVIIADNQMILRQSGRLQSTLVVGAGGGSPFYQSVDVANVTGSSGWQVGLVFGYQDVANYYRVLLNDRGAWRVVHMEGGTERIVRDWGTHPAIFPARPNFRLSALVNGFGVDVFYDGQYVGTATDYQVIPDGVTGIAITAASVNEATASAQFTNFVITQPLQTQAGRVFPQQLIAEGGLSTVRELERRNLIPTGGRMSVQINNGFVRNTIAGVSRFPITDQVYGNFAIGATVTWQKPDDLINGCGLSLRDNLVEDRFALAYVDSENGYGLAWHEDGAFSDSIYNNILPTTTGDSYDMLVIATGDEIHYYLDGQYVGTLTESQAVGQIGEVVVNFDTLTTTCNFSNIWVWEWV